MKTPNRAHYPVTPPVRHHQEEKHVLDYARMLYKRRWLALPVFLIIFVLGSVNVFRETPLYRAQAQLLIEQETPNMGTIDQMFQARDTWYTDEFYQTQYRILQSRSLAKKTIDQMNLWEAARLGNGPEPMGPLGPGWVLAKTIAFARSLMGSAPPEETTTPIAVGRPADETAAQADRIDEFQGGLSIEPIRNSRLVDIMYTSTDPVFAAQAANAVAKAYIDQSMEFRFTESRDATDFLSDRLSEQRKALEASEAALQAYRERNGALSVTDSASNIVVQRLTDLNSALTRAKTERINKEALYNQLNAAQGLGSIESYPAVQANDYIQKLRGDLTDLQRQQAQLAERYGERHAEMIKIRATIETAEAKLKTELAKVVESVKNQYMAALSEERSLQGALDAQKVEALSLNRKGIEYGVLQREVESNRQIYESLMQRTKETNISRERRTTNIRVVDPAEVPRGPISPNIQRALMMSFVASLALSLGLVFFVEYLDNRLKTPQDVKTHLPVPFLGMVPAAARDKDRMNPLLSDTGISANFSEAFKSVRTNVLFSTAEEGLRSLVVTSAGPGDGKSIVSANLAIALAQAGRRVLLVDADMRRPRVHEIFGIDDEPGFSNLLTGNAKASEVIRKSGTPGLWLVSAGHIPPNPAELLGSPRYIDFIAALDDHFDWVVVDTPPVLVVADSTIVANQATGVVFVVGADKTGRHAAKTAVEQLLATNANVVGTVLNRANVHANPHYYSSYYRKEYSRYYVKS